MFGISTLEAIGAAALIAGVLGFSSGMMLMHKIEVGKYEKLELSYKDAQIKAVEQAQEDQKALDNVALNAAQREAATQAALTARAKQQLAEVSKHVKTNPTGCVTYGFVRVLDGAVHGVLAERLALPAGKSDDACTNLNAADVARSVVDNYNTAEANRQQLDALIAVLRTMKDTQNAQHSKH